VLATDGGNLQSTCSLLVEILDINDNPPIFKEPTYSFKVPYGSVIGHAVGTVVADDADIAENAAIRYTVITNPGDYFEFDETSTFTGTLKTTKSLPNPQDIQVTGLISQCYKCRNNFMH